MSFETHDSASAPEALNSATSRDHNNVPFSRFGVPRRMQNFLLAMALTQAGCFPRLEIKLPDSADTGLSDSGGSSDSGTTDSGGSDSGVEDRDSDGDGISDNVETDSECLDPNNPDTDGDEISDGQEISQGTNPCVSDTDGDGLRDGWEVQHGFDPLSTNESLQDPDNDGLTNLQEQMYGTDPRALDATVFHDTDGDGEFGVLFGLGENLALGKPVANFVDGDETYAHPPEHLVDGDTSTQAYPAAAEMNYLVDLEAISQVGEVQLNWGVYGTSTYADHFTAWSLEATLLDGTVVVLATETATPEATQSLVALSLEASELPITHLRLQGEGTGWLGAHELSAYAQPEL